MQRPEMPRVIALDDARPAQRGIRILVADDNADIRLTLSALLQHEGYAVRTVEDGLGVAALLKSFQPDVCILDIEMPGASGYAIARELSDIPVRDRPLLIAISGVWVRPSERLLAIMVGFDHFFQKPADPKKLLDVLVDFQRGKRARESSQRVHIAGSSA